MSDKRSSGRDLFISPFFQARIDIIGEHLAAQTFPPPALRTGESFNLSLIVAVAIARLADDVEAGLFDPEKLPEYARKHFEQAKQRSPATRHGLYRSDETINNMNRIGAYLETLPDDLRPSRVRIGEGYNLRLLTSLALMWSAHRIRELEGIT